MIIIHLFFLNYFILSIPVTYILRTDNFLSYVHVNGSPTTTEAKKSSHKFYTGSFEGEERDLITIGVENNKDEIGLFGKITFGVHLFFIGDNSFSFLYANSPLQSYKSEYYYHIGYDADDENGEFYYPIPKIIIVDFNSTIRENGYSFDYSEIFTSNGYLEFLSLPKGKLSSPLCGDFQTGMSYSSSCSIFNYKPISKGEDKANYRCSNKREALLFLIVNQGYDAIYLEDSNSATVKEFPCRDLFNPIYNSPSSCLSEDTKGNYYLETDSLYHICDESCKFCEIVPERCLECNTSYMENPHIKYNCYLPCDYNHYFNETNYYICLKSNEGCPSTFPLLVVDTKECVKSCPTDYPLLIEEKGECHNACTDEYPYLLGDLKKCKQDCNEDFPLLVEIHNRFSAILYS